MRTGAQVHSPRCLQLPELRAVFPSKLEVRPKHFFGAGRICSPSATRFDGTGQISIKERSQEPRIDSSGEAAYKTNSKEQGKMPPTEMPSCL